MSMFKFAKTQAILLGAFTACDVPGDEPMLRGSDAIDESYEDLKLARADPGTAQTPSTGPGSRRSIPSVSEAACESCTDVHEHCPDIGGVESPFCVAACEVEKREDLIDCLQKSVEAYGAADACYSCISGLASISAGALVAACVVVCGPAAVALGAAYDSCTKESECVPLPPPPPPPPPEADTWIGTVREGEQSNALFPLNGSINPPAVDAPWKTCPPDRELIGAGGDTADQGFWLCTTAAKAADTFFVARMVNAAAFVYRVQGGSVESMGKIEYQNCPMLSSPIGGLVVAGGFWVCAGGGISPPPAGVPAHTPVVTSPLVPESLDQQWFFDPISGSPSRSPADLEASGAEFMIVNRGTGMALDHSGSIKIDVWWIAVLSEYVWKAKSMHWRFEKDPALDRYLIWGGGATSDQVLDIIGISDPNPPVALIDKLDVGPGQRWDIRKVEGDYYNIVNTYSDFALTFKRP